MIFIFIKFFKIYKKNQKELLDNYTNDIYKDILNELNLIIKEKIIKDPLINLNEKFNDFFLKKKIPQNKKSEIFFKLNDLFDKENSQILKVFFHIDGKIQTYLKLKNLSFYFLDS